MNAVFSVVLFDMAGWGQTLAWAGLAGLGQALGWARVKPWAGLWSSPGKIGQKIGRGELARSAVKRKWAPGHPTVRSRFAVKRKTAPGRLRVR